ncbi:MAG: hypothetical protein QXT77_09120 [Candidatus Methanomethylicaceae archaeon]
MSLDKSFVLCFEAGYLAFELYLLLFTLLLDFLALLLYSAASFVQNLAGRIDAIGKIALQAGDVRILLGTIGRGKDAGSVEAANNVIDVA